MYLIDQWGENTLTGQKTRVDRFVIPRDFLSEICRRMSWNTECDDKDEIWSTKYLQRKRYMKFLNVAFRLTPRDQARLSASKDWSWPCEPRRRTCLSTADNVLDLPAYRFATFPDLIDWSNDNILVAALGKRYYKWSWVTQTPLSRGFTTYNIQCCKFDPKGNLLLGTDLRAEIHDKRNKCFFVHYCKCNISLCTITAIDWSPTGRSYVMGCSRGMICSVAVEGYYNTKFIRLLESATHAVRVSPNARYVAVVGINATIVWIMTWPELKRFRFLRTYVTVKDMNWHPWQSAMLGIATLFPDRHASVVIWEPHSDRLRQERIGRGLYSIDAMKFNHRTGELLLSMWSLGVRYPNCSELVVLSDFDSVVDRWAGDRTGVTRVRTMVFSPDGTKLATATADEDLIIWNFLPNDYKKNKHRIKSDEMLKPLDVATLSSSLR